MISAKEFLSDFTRDIVAHPSERPAIIAGYARHMEARENSIIFHELEAISLEATHAPFDSVETHYQEAVLSRLSGRRNIPRVEAQDAST